MRIEDFVGSVPAAGWHALRIVAAPEDVDAADLGWSGPGFARQPVPDDFLCHLPVDVPPHVELTAARPWYVEGGTVRLTAAAMDVAGRVVETGVRLEGGETLALSPSARAVAAVADAAAGAYAFAAWAVDDGGNVSATSRLEVAVLDADGDPDGDGLTNAEEFRAGTDPSRRTRTTTASPTPRSCASGRPRRARTRRTTRTATASRTLTSGAWGQTP